MPVFDLARKKVGARKPWGYSGSVTTEGADGILAGGASFESTIDGPTVYKEFSSIYIPENQIVTVANRCKGLVIKCLGDCIIDGKLSMTARGCRGEGELFAPWGIDNVHTPTGSVDMSIGADGGAGADRRYYYGINSGVSGYSGSNGVNGACGGGGSGGVACIYDMDGAYSGAGARGTTWSGGGGGGGGISGRYVSGTVYGGNAESNGGAGGSGEARGDDYYTRVSAGGGAGNPGGQGEYNASTTPYFYGDSGAGGLLILIVKGRLIISDTGSIESKGSSGASPTWGWDRVGGGSSGGGSITIIHQGDYIKNGIVTVAGGPVAPADHGNGGRGGDGSLRVQKGRVW
jgi:hypothetical protein